MNSGPEAGVSQDERVQAEAYVRSVAIESAKGFQLGEGLLSQIVARVTDDLNGGTGGHRSMAQRMQMAGEIAKQYTATQKPLNLLSATPQEIAAQNQAGAFGNFDLLRDMRRGSSAGYQRELAGNVTDKGVAESLGISTETASGLAAMGFTTTAQAQAFINDTLLLGIDRNRGVMALATLKRYDGANYQKHVEFLNTTHRHDMEKIREVDEKIAKEADPTKKAELQGVRAEHQREERRHWQEHRDGIRDPHAKRAFDDLGALTNNSYSWSGSPQPTATHDHGPEPQGRPTSRAYGSLPKAGKPPAAPHQPPVSPRQAALQPDADLNGAQASRNTGHAERRANLSKAQRQQIAEAEAKKLKESQARGDQARAEIRRSQWTDDDDTPPQATAQNNDKNKVPPEPNKPVVQTKAAKARGVEPAKPESPVKQAQAAKPSAPTMGG
ncbi:MAG TPA: hypothetical protein VHB73_06055 [Alphaproteobacteria bacterium]|nr:hypothetical protein [Alphaproteobacteria bacterium]